MKHSIIEKKLVTLTCANSTTAPS